MQAIVLSRRSFREYDEIVSLYTHDLGRVELLAKGNKKIVSKQSAQLEPFSIVTITVIPGKQIDHLAKAQLIEAFPRLRSDLPKSLLAGYAVSLTHYLVGERTPDRRIFFALKSWLEFLDTTARPKTLVLDSYVMVLMGCLGFTPQLERCVVCNLDFKEIARKLLADEAGTKPGIYYAGGGLICGACRLLKEKAGEEIATVGFQELSGLMLLVQGDWRLVEDFMIDAAEAERLHKVVYEFVVYHSEVALRDWS